MLIIDDNVSFAENIAEIPQIDGYLTNVAASAKEAFPMALASEPDVVVTDYGCRDQRGRFDTTPKVQSAIVEAPPRDRVLGVGFSPW